MNLIAHRCGTDVYPELTIEAAKHSLAAGAVYAEADIRKTSDGAFVVCHDKTARRLFGDERKISVMTLSEFLSLRHVSDTRYPAYSLEDFLKGGVRNILYHIKEGGENLPALLELCSRYGVLSDGVFGLQSAEDVVTVKTLFPCSKILAFMPIPDLVEEFSAAGAEYIRLWEDWMTPENIRRVKQTGKALWVMAGNPVLPGYTDEENPALWEREGAEAILVNEVVRFKKYSP